MTTKLRLTLDGVLDLRSGGMSMYEFYVNMQERGDGRVYADLHKTDERIYFNKEDAQRAIDADPELSPYRHVVKLIAVLPELIK